MKFNYKNNEGFLLLLVFLVVFLLLLMSLYFYSFIITELKISKNQSVAEQCYYLAEAGVEETIWKLRNDNSWKTNFENGTCNPCTFSRDPIFFAGGAYDVSLQSTGQAKGEITSVGTYTLLPSDITAQRIIKIKAFKAQQSVFTEEIALYSGDGDINVSWSDPEVINGGIFSNDDINVNYNAFPHTTETASVTLGGSINYCLWGYGHPTYCDLIADGSVGYESDQDQWSPPIEMPKLNFDDPNSSTSYKYIAEHNYTPDHLYSQGEFEQMLKNATDQGQPLTLSNGIHYVTGHIKIKRGQSLIVNGVLAADNSITIGIGGSGADANVTVNNPSDPTFDQPSGLLSKGSILSNNWANNINVEGLLYANDQVQFTDFNVNLTVNGGIIARGVTFSSLFDAINITYNKNIIQNTLGGSTFSPVVTVEHWEEEY
ncbi:MAG: hypothetical protein V1692_02810 [bacterium]